VPYQERPVRHEYRLTERQLLDDRGELRDPVADGTPFTVLYGFPAPTSAPTRHRGERGGGAGDGQASERGGMIRASTSRAYSSSYTPSVSST